MSIQRSDFPVQGRDYTRSLGDAPIMLDGMEVLFDRTVGLAPVQLVPKQPASDDATRNGQARRK